MSDQSSKKAAHVSQSNVSAHPAIAAVPAQVSSAPEGWVAPKRIGKKGRRPSIGLTLAAPDLVTELLTNAEALASELGPKSVDPTVLATAIQLAYGWRKTEAQSKDFNTFARVQRGASWDAAMTLYAGMRDGVRYAIRRDATFSDRFPNVAKVFAPKKRASKKGPSKTPAPLAAKSDASPASNTPAADAPNAKPATS